MVSIKNYMMVVLCLLTIVKTKEEKEKLNTEVNFEVDGDKIKYSINMKETVPFVLDNDFNYITFSKKEMECKKENGCTFVNNEDVLKNVCSYKDEKDTKKFEGKFVIIKFNQDGYNEDEKENKSIQVCYIEEEIENFVPSFEFDNFLEFVKVNYNLESDFKIQLDIDYKNEKSEEAKIKEYNSIKMIVDFDLKETKELKNGEELNLSASGDLNTEIKDLKLKSNIQLDFVNNKYISLSTAETKFNELITLWNVKDKKVDLKLKKIKDDSVFNDYTLSNNEDSKQELKFEFFNSNEIILNSGFYKDDYSVIINAQFNEDKTFKSKELSLISKSSGGSGLVVILIIIACLIAAAALCLIFLKIVKKKNVDEDDDDEYVKQE